MTSEEFKLVQKVKENKLYEEIFPWGITKINSEVVKAIESIAKETNQDKINAILREYNINTMVKYSMIYALLCDLDKEETKKLIASLKEKIDKYEKFLASEKKKEREVNKELKDGQSKQNKISSLEIAHKYVSEYIQGEYKTIEDFCSINNLERNTFPKYVKLIKEFNNELYEEYLTKIKKHQVTNFNLIIEDIINIIAVMKNNSNFNILDYYLNTHFRVDFERTFQIARTIPDIDNSDLVMLRTFYKKNENYQKNNFVAIKTLMDSKRLIGCKYDDAGKYIEGTGRQITQEEKNDIIIFLKENNIPINDRICNLAVTKFARNQLFKNEIENSLRTK